jgi:hypothetical protein
MRRLRLLVVTIALLAAACSEGGEITEAVDTSAYPTAAAEVIADARYALTYTSPDTGIAYYVRSVSADEVDRLPSDYMIEADTGRYVFVPIKDDAIVEAPLKDRIGLGYAFTPDATKQ